MMKVMGEEGATGSGNNVAGKLGVVARLEPPAQDDDATVPTMKRPPKPPPSSGASSQQQETEDDSDSSQKDDEGEEHEEGPEGQSEATGGAKNDSASGSSAQGERKAQLLSELKPGGSSGRKRGQTNADKEHKRLKRLLRNRVSAQQARERKKVYLTDLEQRTKDLEQHNAELEERVSTLQRENFMLRQVVKNTALKK